MFNMRITCNAAHVKSVLWLLLNMLQHVLGNNLQFNFRARQVINKEISPHWRLSFFQMMSNFLKHPGSSQIDLSPLERLNMSHALLLYLRSSAHSRTLRKVIVRVEPMLKSVFSMCRSRAKLQC